MHGTISDQPNRLTDHLRLSRSDWRLLIEALVLAVLFFILAKTGIELTRGAGRIAAVWLPNAVVVAILLRRPVQFMWPMAAATAAANILANISVGDELPLAMGLALANSVEILIAVMLARRFCGTYPDAHSFQSLMVLTFGASVVAPVLSGIVATLVLGPHQWPEALATWESWVVPDALGMLLALPALLVLIDGLRQRPEFSWRMALESSGIFLIGIAVSLMIFMQSSYPLLFLSAPVVLLQAFRQGGAGTALATVTMAGIAIYATASDLGPISLMNSDPWQRIMILQLFLATVFLMGLPISAMLADKRKAMIELEAHKQDLRFAHEKTQQALASKAQFLANMSHEIRTPMNGVLGFADLLGRTNLTNDQRKKVDVIISSGTSMMKILNDILDVSKIEAGSITIARASIDLRELLDECVTLSSAQAGNKGLGLSLKIAGDLPTMIEADPLRLRQVVLNLIANAIKFTDRGGVVISAVVDQSEIRIAVQDTGIGVPPERLNAIFQPFEQADSTTSRQFGGTGLGLSISHELARLMGGSLAVTSAQGNGSTFTLTLPLIVDEAAIAPAVPAAQPVIEAAPSRANARVLLAEDHEVNRELVREMLAELGYNVEMVVDGNEAVEMTLAARAEGVPYDLVLMDIQMPHCDGYQAARTIRAAGISGTDLPIIAMTANAYPEDIEAAHASGMQGHLAKPLSLDRLDRLMQMTLGRSQACETDLRSNSRLAEMWTRNCNNASNAVREYLDTPVPTPQQRATCSTHAHQLAGTAARFGASELGKLAAIVERALAATANDEEARVLMQQFLTELGHADRRKPAK